MEYLHGEGRHPTLHCSTLAAVYPPSGRCVGTLSLERLDALHRLYCRMPADAPCKPALPDWLANVLRAYPTTAKTPALSQCDPMGEVWALPPLVLDTLASAFAVMCELFLTPLIFLPSVLQYRSLAATDSAFGSGGLPYSTPWRGLTLAVPPCTPVCIGP